MAYHNLYDKKTTDYIAYRWWKFKSDRFSVHMKEYSDILGIPKYLVSTIIKIGTFDLAEAWGLQPDADIETCRRVSRATGLKGTVIWDMSTYMGSILGTRHNKELKEKLDTGQRRRRKEPVTRDYGEKSIPKELIDDVIDSTW